MSVPNPLALWRDAKGGIPAPTRLVPYKTTGGYWVFVTQGDGPVGSTQGAMVSGTYDTLVTSTTTGLAVVRSPGGALLFR